MYYFIIIGIIIVADQISKYYIQSNMYLTQSVPVIEGILHITYIHNFGAAFNIFEGMRILLIIITLSANAAFLVIIFLKRKKAHWSLLLSLSFIAGGGIGNLINRIFIGYVVDFIDLRFWPVFNVSDIFVCTGCGILLLYMFYFEPGYNRHKIAEEGADSGNALNGKG